MTDYLNSDFLKSLWESKEFKSFAERYYLKDGMELCDSKYMGKHYIEALKQLGYHKIFQFYEVPVKGTEKYNELMNLYCKLRAEELKNN